MSPIMQDSGLESSAGNLSPRKDLEFNMNYILFPSSRHLMAFTNNDRYVAEESAVIPGEHQDLRFDARTLFLHVRPTSGITATLVRMQEVLLHLFELLP